MVCTASCLSPDFVPRSEGLYCLFSVMKKREMTTPWLQSLQISIALHKSGFLFSHVALGNDPNVCEERCLSTDCSNHGRGGEVGTSAAWHHEKTPEGFTQGEPKVLSLCTKPQFTAAPRDLKEPSQRILCSEIIS